MKRTVLCLLLLTAMAVTGAALWLHTGRVTDDISARLTGLERMPDAKTARDISADWEDFCDSNIFLTNNECAFEISQALVRIAAGLESGRDSAEDIRFARALVAIYRRSCAPAPENIF